MFGQNGLELLNDESLIERAKTFAGEIQMTVPESSEECWQQVIILEEQAIVNAAKRGILLLKLKADTPHGEFGSALEQHGINPRRAQEAITVAKMLLAMPDAKAQTFAHLNLNKSQLKELSTVPVEILSKLDDDDLESLSNMSVRNMAKEIERLKVENKKLDADKAEAINDLNDEQQRKAPTERHGFPVAFAEIRSDAVALPAVLNEALEQTMKNINVLCPFSTAEGTQGEGAVAAAQAIHHSWGSIGVQIHQLLTKLNDHFGDRIQGLENLPVFSNSEWGFIEPEFDRVVESYRAMSKTSS